MPCSGLPWICCEDETCCTHRKISDAPVVQWSKSIDEAATTPPTCRQSIVAVATDGANFFTAFDNRVQKWDTDGNLLWDVGTVGIMIGALTATTNHVWAAGYAPGGGIFPETDATFAVVRFASSDGTTDWVVTGDVLGITFGANALTTSPISIASEGTDCWVAGVVLTSGGFSGVGLAIDGSGTVVGEFGGTDWEHASVARRGIVVGGNAVYIAGGVQPADTACPFPAGTYPSVTKWNASTLDCVWAAGTTPCGPLGLRTGTGLYVANRGVGSTACNLELWDEATAEPQWGVLVRGPGQLDGVETANRKAEILDLSIADASQLWAIIRVYDQVGSVTLSSQWTEALRQYDTGGSLTACCPSHYLGVAAFGSGVFAGGTPVSCTIADSQACPTDTTCTPDETCDMACGECNIYGDMVIAECACLDGIGDACITVESLSCPGLNSGGEQPTRTFVGEGGGGQWYLTYEIDPDPACGTPLHQVDVSVLYDCDTGWSCEVIVSFQNGTTTYTITDFEQSASCNPITVTFQANGLQDVAECMGCDVDLDLMVRLDAECAEAMMAAPLAMRAASAKRLPARLMASIDGPDVVVGLLLERSTEDDAGDWTDAGGLLRFNEDIATIGDDDGPVTILSRRPFVAVATVGQNELIVTEEP